MSYFRKNIEQLDGYVPGFQPEATEVVKLNTNENPYPPSPKVVEAVRNISPEKLRRYPSPLGDEFRNAAAKIHSVSPDNILCCNGGDDLLTIAIRSFCDENRTLAYPSPTYSLYPVLAAIQNCQPPIELPYPADFSLPEGLADTGAALTIVCNPNAPTGSFVESSKLKALAEKLSGKGVLLIDEAYADFAESNCIDLIETCKNVIILRSMSKGYSLAGIRFGYAIACEELIAGLRKVKDSYNVDSMAITAAAAAIGDQAYFKGNIEKIKSERARLIKGLEALGFTVPQSQTNFVLAKCNNCDAGDIYNKLAEQNVFVRYFKLPSLEDKLRITVGTAEENDKLLAALKTIMPS
jgi:histidinol-phosphate aminotransferase